MDPQTEIQKLQKELEEYTSKKYFHMKKSDEFSKLELETENKIKSLCPHKNTVREKDSGPYPETHIFCKDCKLYL